jgi:putative transcriptional regulator
VYHDEKHSEKDYLLRLGSRIKEIRLSKKIAQTEIAYKCNFDKSNYNTIESGKRNPTVLSLFKIAKALDVDIKELLTF